VLDTVSAPLACDELFVCICVSVVKSTVGAFVHVTWVSSLSMYAAFNFFLGQDVTLSTKLDL